MDERLEIRKVNENYEVNYFTSKKGKASYTNVLNPDATKIAMILIDLEITTGLPIFEGVKRYMQRREARDWLGL